VQLWEVETGERLATHDFPGKAPPEPPGEQLWQVVCTPDNRLLACVVRGLAVQVWDLKAGKRLTATSGHEAPVVGLGFIDCGKSLYSISDDAMVCRWDVAAGKEGKRHRLRDPLRVEKPMPVLGGLGGLGPVPLRHPPEIGSAVVSPDGQYLLSTASSTLLWELKTGREVCAFPFDPVMAGPQLFSADGKRVVLGDANSALVTVYAAANGRRVTRLRGVKDRLFSVALSPDGTTVAANLSAPAGDDTALQVWDADTGKTRWSRPRNDPFGGGVAFSPDGS